MLNRVAILKLLLLAFFIFGAVACTEKKMVEPIDPYYLRIKGVLLKIPASYLQPSMASHPKNAEEARRLARSAPGWDVSSVEMILGLDDMAGMTHSDTNKVPRPRYMSVWVSTSQPLPDIAKALPSNWIREPLFDDAGLKGYRDSMEKLDATANMMEIDRHYFIENPPNGLIGITCLGWPLPNPICKVRLIWQGIRLVYWFDHKNLKQWSSFHPQLISKLDSFLVP